MWYEVDFRSNKFFFGLYLATALLAIPTVIQVASCLETKFNPVVEDFELKTQIETQAGHTILAGTYERKRDCTFKNITWYTRDDLTKERVPIPINRKVTPANKPIGTYSFGPWELWMTKQKMETDSFAVVLHDCHPLYLTRSVIYSKGTFK